MELNPAACVGCGRCVEVCPHQVFRVENKKAMLVDRDGCMECGACAVNCPADAIAVESGVGCAIGLLGEYLKERKIRKILGSRSTSGCG